jgi:hypothetical protein
MLAAAARFKEAWEADMRRSSSGAVLSDREIVEMHEAALALVWATGTTNLGEALDVMRQLDA